MGGKVGLRCKGKTLPTKVLDKKFVDNAQQCLSEKDKTKNSNVHDSLKVMGSNPGYLLKFFLLQIFEILLKNSNQKSMQKSVLLQSSAVFDDKISYSGNSIIPKTNMYSSNPLRPRHHVTLYTQKTMRRRVLSYFNGTSSKSVSLI